MAYPTIARTYNITQTRAVYTSLLGVIGDGMYKLKVELLAAGWTMWASSNGTTGPTDASDRTDRIASAADFATRAAAAAAPQSYFVVKSTRGDYVLVTYQGATDDVVRLSWTLDGYTLAATKTHQPTSTTASQERLIASAASIIANTTSGDRIFQIWASTDGLSFRMAIASANLHVGLVIGFETLTPAPYAATGRTVPPVFGWSAAVANVASTNLSNQDMGLFTPTVGGIQYSGATRFTTPGAGVSSFFSALGNNVGNLQGDYLIQYVGLVCTTTVGCRGVIGEVIDMWQGNATIVPGDTYDGYRYLAIGSAASTVVPSIWPWSAVLGAPVMT